MNPDLTPCQRELALSRMRRWLAQWQTASLKRVVDDDTIPAILREGAAEELNRRTHHQPRKETA